MGILWIPIMSNISGVLYVYLQKIQAYIAPPITAVFLLGIFYKRINAHGAFVTLVAGFVIAALRIILELMKPFISEESIFYYFGNMNFLLFGVYFFLICILIAVIVSLLTPAMNIDKIKGLTYGTLTKEQIKQNKRSYNWVDITISTVIIVIVVFVMILFSGK